MHTILISTQMPHNFSSRPPRWPPPYRVGDNSISVFLLSKKRPLLPRHGKHPAPALFFHVGRRQYILDHAWQCCRIVEGLQPEVITLYLWDHPPTVILSTGSKSALVSFLDHLDLVQKSRSCLVSSSTPSTCFCDCLQLYDSKSVSEVLCMRRLCPIDLAATVNF